MNTQTSITFVSAAALAALLGCSTPKPVAPVAADPPPLTELTELALFETPNVVPWTEPFGQVCKLGTSCLAMDPRPFEPCLLSTKKCSDKVIEPLLAEQPLTIVPPRIIEIAR